MNKFQKLVGLVIISFFILFIACSKSKEPTEDISKLDNKEAITNEVITNNNDSNQTSENDSEEISSDNMIISDGLEEASVLEQENIVKTKKIITMKNGLQDESIHNIQVISSLDTATINERDTLDVNIKSGSNQILLCNDYQNDIVYYINYGRDYFIYRIKDGKSELVVEMPAKSLFYKRGKLYFMLESYDNYTLKEVKDGNIFSYNPNNGEVKKLVDDVATTMYVYEDGIYYYVDSIDDKLNDGKRTADRKYYIYSFYTTKIVEINDDISSIYKWKDYYLTYVFELQQEDINGLLDVVGLKLETLDKKESIELSDIEIPQFYSFVGDKIYYAYDSKYLTIYDITSNEKVVKSTIKSFSDFTLLDGYIYTDSMIRINIDTKEQSFISPTKDADRILEIYTDGNNLYGLCENDETGYSVMKKIMIEEQNNLAIFVKFRNGEVCELFRYFYYTQPIGEELEQ